MQTSFDLITVYDYLIKEDYIINTLMSLQRLRYPKELLNTVIVYGNDYGHPSSNIIGLCMKMQATLVFTSRKDKPMNLGLMRNIGARSSSSSSILFTDADVIIHPDTLEYANDALKDCSFAAVPCVRHPENPFNYNFDLQEDSDWEKAAADLEVRRGAFGIAAVARSVFEHVRGYDERFAGWGCEDTDLYRRLLHFKGAILLTDKGCPPSIHQAHPERPWKTHNNVKKNRKLLKRIEKTDQDIRRNDHSWGGIACSASP